MAAVSSWSSGTLACMSDCGECCDTMCCMYCKLGKIKGRMDTGIPNMSMLCCCVPLLLDMFAVSFASTIAACLIRKEVVEKYGIEESPVMTCLCSVCCKYCAICQMTREMAVRGESPGGCCCQPSTAPTIM